MTKIECITFPTGIEKLTQTGVHRAARVAPRSNVVPISAPALQPTLVPPVARRQHLGRKGRRALAERRALEGAYLSVALGAVALLWWSTF